MEPSSLEPVDLGIRRKPTTTTLQVNPEMEQLLLDMCTSAAQHILTGSCPTGSPRLDRLAQIWATD